MSAVAGVIDVTWGRRRVRKPRPPDRGTPEAIAKREELIGKGANPQLASYPLGILLAKNLITQDQHNAGERYGGLAQEILSIGPKEATTGNEPDEAAAFRMLAEWRFICAALISVSREVKEATDEICVYKRPANVAQVRDGLVTLQKVFYGRRT